jgi:hypothetical protein
MDQSPFELIFNYNDKEIINKNFTITIELHHDDFILPINCENRLCLVKLALQVQSNQMSIDVWCQSPALSFANFHRFQTFHTCILLEINATQQPSITMIINSHDIGKVNLLATANFTYSPEYFIEKQGEKPIEIVVRMNF